MKARTESRAKKIVDISQYNELPPRGVDADEHSPLMVLHLTAVSVFIFSSLVSFAGDTYLNYLLSIYFVYFFIINFDRIFPLIPGTWFLFLFPVWGVLSVLWAELPGVAAKSSIQIFLTIILCYLVVFWFREKTFVQIILWTTFPTAVLSLIFMNSHGDGVIGIFDQKNQLGFVMTLLIIAAVFILLDKDASLVPKLLSLLSIPLAVPLLIASNSATAIVVALLALCLAGALFVFTSRGSLFSAWKIALIFFGSGFAALLAAAIMALMQTNPVDALLLALGKDTTLTGRTGLWDYAESVIAQRPFLGVGEGGFWRYADNPLVQRIFEEYHKRPGQGFSFHNAYYETAVHQGLIGLGLSIITLVWCLSRIASLALLEGGMARGFLFAVMVVLLIRTSIETGLVGPFQILTTVACCGAIYYQREVTTS